MKLNTRIIKKSITCFCLLIYVLFGILSTNAISICYGSEHSRHLGLNILGYEPCCHAENATHQSMINPKNNHSFFQSKCNCQDEKIVCDNQSQLTNVNYISTLSDIKFENIQASPQFISFEEKYNKINWNIYNYRRNNNQLAMLDTVILNI